MYKTYGNKITNLIYFYVYYDINLMGTTYYINIKFSWDAMLCIAQRSKWQNSFNSIKTFWWKKVCILAFKNWNNSWTKSNNMIVMNKLQCFDTVSIK